jgi:hypothetical protein
MAIRDIICLGFGNGTYDPGVSKLPTLGYSIGVITFDDDNSAYRPGRVSATSEYRPWTVSRTSEYRPDRQDK